MPIKRLAWLAVAVCLAVQPILHAQKGKGPKPEPVDTPGEAWLDPRAEQWIFDEDEDDGEIETGYADWDQNGCQNTAPGGIYGDGALGDEQPYVSDPATGARAVLRASDGDFLFDVRGPRFAYVYFTDPDPASTPLSPRKEFCAVALQEFHLHTHVLRQDGSDDIRLGLLDIAPGDTHPARILGNFYINGIRYQFRFNAALYPGTTNVKITRGFQGNPDLDENSWLIETGAGAVGSGDIVQLQSPPLTKRSPGQNDEGRYRFPFTIKFTIQP